MRFLSFLAAALVTLALYMFVFEREAIFALARGDVSAAQELLSTPPETSGSGGALSPGEAEAIVAARSAGQTRDTRVGVVVLRSQAQDIDNAVLLRGETEASRRVTVSAETSGRVISPPISAGTEIATGDVLCSLDPGTRQARLAEAQARLAEVIARRPEAEARVTEALARLEEARINDNAASRLGERGFASDQQVASARATISSAEAGVEGARAGLSAYDSQIESAEASVAVAREEISRLQLKAPFDGVLEQDTAETGALMQPGAVCASLYQLDPIRVVGFVAEMEVGRVVEGARAGARLATGEELVGRVSHVARTADAATRTFRVEVDVPNPALRIRAGQTAEIIIASEAATAHLLPGSALTLDDEGRLGVRVVDEDEIARFHPVRLLRDTADGVYVEGLGAEANVIVVGQDFVRDGVAVRPSWRDEDAGMEMGQ